MDLVLCLQKLIPNAQFNGSLTDNSKNSYDNLYWYDETYPKPSWDDVCNVWIQVEREMKLKVLKEIREYILFETVTRIHQQRATEKDDIELNGATITKITDDIYKQWLLYWRYLRDLPEIVNIDNYSIEEISNLNNHEIYGTYPTTI